MNQIGEQVKNHLATLLATGQIADPRLRTVTITAVRMTPDLQNARVSYSVLGGETEKAAAAKGWQAASGFLRSSVGEALRIRYTPQLSFHFDAAAEHSARISGLLNQLTRETEHDASPESTEDHLPEKKG
jgi:ribosome-binding factor A